jgi:hypothetical protein
MRINHAVFNIKIKNMNQLISFDHAKKLQELGFNEPCSVFYSTYPHQSSPVRLLDEKRTFSYFGEVTVPAPTYHEVINWARKLGYEIWVQPWVNDYDLTYDKWKLDGTYSYYMFRNNLYIEDGADQKTIEEAYINAIDGFIDDFTNHKIYKQ